MEVALPGNATFEFDDPGSCDHETKASRFALVRHEVVEGDSGSFRRIRRDYESFWQEGSRGEGRRRCRHETRGVHDQPGFIAPDDRAGVTGRNESVRCDFFFEISPRALGAAL